MEATSDDRRRPGRLIGLVGLLLGGLALATPLLAERVSFLALGVLILTFGLLQNFAGFTLRDPGLAGAWMARGGPSIVTGLLLIALPKLTFAGLAVLLGLSWAVGGLSAMVTAAARRGEPEWFWSLVDGAVSVALGIAVALQWPVSGAVSVGLFVGLRYLSAGWSMLAGPAPVAPEDADAAEMHPDRRLGLAPHAYVGQLRDELAREETIRGKSDRAWIALFLVTFFAIHAARMDTDWNLVGLLSPAGAVVGDVCLAVVLAYGLVAPLSVMWRGVTRPLERRAWTWYLARRDRGAGGLRSAGVGWWLTRRMRSAVRTRQAHGSPTAALGWGLRAGLPGAAILMALTPLWGVSWFFDPETWVTGAWEAWAEKRTDTWRVAMIDAVRGEYGPAAADPDFFRVAPEGLDGAENFSFIVIGDTGEGDASQHILRDQLFLAGQRPEVKFLVVSSDVIYPSGAMKDYEPKFYLPFKGFGKPIYAVPGNHDWYDALESFTANFFEPKAARAAMRARREVDLNLTTTTEARTDGMIREAERLRGEYRIQAARQRAPYFEIRTDRFALVVVDTGILRQVDDDQLRWLDAALARGAGRFRMALLGHPLYAAGHYQGVDEPFARVHRLLKKHGVEVVMAGDTHDFEFYKEPAAGPDDRPTYHFVNGGGGAYLSIGTSLDWPSRPPVAECGFYPRADALTAALEAHMPMWKQPFWFWVRRLHAWPSTPETASAAFSYDRAPFFQSFIEVRVEGSTNTVRYWLYGSNGRLRWRDLYLQAGAPPNGQSPDDLVEFAFPLRAASPQR